MASPCPCSRWRARERPAWARAHPWSPPSVPSQCPCRGCSASASSPRRGAILSTRAWRGRSRPRSRGWAGFSAPAGAAATRVSSSRRGSGRIIRVPPRRLSALVLRVPLDPTPLAARWVCEADGVVVASGPLSHTLQWVNGAPRAGRQALLTVVLPGTSASEVRLIFQDAGPPLGVGEVFLYGPDEGARPADGAAAAESAYGAARRGSWDEAVRLYGDALRAEPDRASYHACLARAERRAARRPDLDVESLDDGGAELVERR